MNIEVISGSEKITGEKIRYINYDNDNYIIYSLKEQDEEGYEKLYINKITNEEEDIISDLEWEELKKVIPIIVKQIKINNIIDFNDLDLSEINKINLKYSKPFKLKKDIVKSIKKENLKIEHDLQELINDIPEQVNASIDDLDKFLNNYEEELNRIEVPINPNIEEKEMEIPINPNTEELNEIDNLKELLEEEINKKEELTKKVEELENELNMYKDKLERIKIMLEA